MNIKEKKLPKPSKKQQGRKLVFGNVRFTPGPNAVGSSNASKSSKEIISSFKKAINSGAFNSI